MTDRTDLQCAVFELYLALAAPLAKAKELAAKTRAEHLYMTALEVEMAGVAAYIAEARKALMGRMHPEDRSNSRE